MADITWFKRMFTWKNRETRTADAQAKADEYLLALEGPKDFPPGFTVKYAMEVGYPMVFMYRDGKYIAKKMVHNGDGDAALTELRKTAWFIVKNNVDT